MPNFVCEICNKAFSFNWTLNRHKIKHKSLEPARGVKPVGYEENGKFVIIPEKIPELVVPDLKDCQLKPYVSYRTPDVVQSQFTAEDLFHVIYAPKIANDFKLGKLDEHGHSMEASENEKLTPEQAVIRARQTGSDMF